MHEFLEYRVDDVMTSAPVAVRAETPLREVEAIFTRHDFNGLPVVDADCRLIGLVTKLDVLKAFAFTTQAKIPPYREIVERPAADVMTRDPVTVTPDEALTRVLQRMIETRYKSFPVVAAGRLAGIVSREDIIRALRRATAGLHPDRA
jgi:CBS domain-containing protein